jgi:hypothetical protein
MVSAYFALAAWFFPDDTCCIKNAHCLYQKRSSSYIPN